MTVAHLAIWSVAALATAGVILQPFKVPEAVWAFAGATALVAFGLLPWKNALTGVGKGTDVYLFLTGMLLLSEVAREAGLFDWLASLAASHARGSAKRLFRLIYVVGIGVSVFLSNDATAVVLTPAVAAVTRAVKVEQPLPYLLICAFIANAASFVLPISNPANLVIYAQQMPPLAQWLPRFALPSVAAIGVTYCALEWTQRRSLTHSFSRDIEVPTLSRGGRAAATGIGLTALALMTASAMGWQLGLPTCIAGVVTLISVSALQRQSPWVFIRQISWGVIPLVAGLFVLVEGLEKSGVTPALSQLLHENARHSQDWTAVVAGVVVGFVCNLVNNLPAGLLAGAAVQAASAPAAVASGVLIGIDLGPNLSVTGSLATILWLSALKREGLRVGALDFFKIGALLMPLALAAALGALIVLPGMVALFTDGL